MNARQPPPACISIAMPDSAVTEAFRFLRTAIRASGNPCGRTLLVTSPVEGEGKTSIAVNLAVVSAQEGKTVLLVDGNLRKPRIHTLFRGLNAVGLCSVLIGKCSSREVIEKTSVEGLDFVGAGPRPPFPADLLGSAAMEQFLSHCRAEYDLTIIDSPSLLEVSDTETVAQHVDSILVVARERYTKKEHLLRAKTKLDFFSEKIIGVVVNDRSDN